MRSRPFLLLVCCLTSLALCACGDDERYTPNCDDMSKCVTEPSGGVPLPTDAGGDTNPGPDAAPDAAPDAEAGTD